jgi:putative acetyltransferase
MVGSMPAAPERQAVQQLGERTEMLSTRDAVSDADLEEIRNLFLEYQADIGIDLCFQGFTNELASLPGSYSCPAGRLLLAADRDLVVGCVGLRPLEGRDAEMKRLFVRPLARGRGIGRLLATRVVEEARKANYARVLLDTLPSMEEARSLYRSLGFTAIAPYCPNPIPGALYFALKLRAP